MQNKARSTQNKEKILHSIEELTAIYTSASQQIQKLTPGHLRIMTRGKYTQYFHISQTGDSIGTYIPKSEMDFIKELAQKDYLEKICKLAQKELKQVKAFFKSYKPNELEEAYTTLKQERKELVTPIRLPDDEYAERWQAMPYTGKSFAENTPLLMTAKGERVRSKSEIIIADTLARLGIPYRYEAPLKLEISAQLKTGTTFMDQDDPKTHPRTSGSQVKKATKRLATFYPDFTCLNIRTRKEFIWEHFGMMEDSEYAKNAVEKERIYASAGYVQGVNFIATTETTDMPLNSQYVEMIAEKLLKD